MTRDAFNLAVVKRVDNSLLVITETDATSEDEALWKRIEGVAGVVAVELIYHNFEDLEK